ncbi:hypothetical protein LINGRAHAP2_LOCUS9260 [Linum grandiflorum]
MIFLTKLLSGFVFPVYPINIITVTCWKVWVIWWGSPSVPTLELNIRFGVNSQELRLRLTLQIQHRKEFMWMDSGKGSNTKISHRFVEIMDDLGTVAKIAIRFSVQLLLFQLL